MTKVIDYIRKHTVSLSLTIIQCAIILLIGGLIYPLDMWSMAWTLIFIFFVLILERKITECEIKEEK